MRSLTPLLLLILVSRGLAQEPARVSLCDLLANVEAWNGKMVEVRDLMGYYGFWFETNKCAKSVTVGAVHFPSLVALNTPESRIPPLHKVDFELDKRSWDEFLAVLSRADAARMCVRVTVVGLFETRTPLDALVDRRFGGEQMFGFGDGNIAPGEIVVKSVRDISIEPPSGQVRIAAPGERNIQ